MQLTKDDVEKFIKLKVEAEKEKKPDVNVDGLEPKLRLYLKNSLNSSCVIFVKEIDNSFVSMCVLNMYHLLPGADSKGLTGEISAVFTLKQYRHKGFMKELLKEIIVHAKQIGLTELHCYVSDCGYELYKELGFEETIKGAKFRSMRLGLC